MAIVVRSQCEHFDLSHQIAQLSEGFGEHGKQRRAVGNRCALKGSGDDGGDCEAHGDRDCAGQSAFGKAEHSEEFAGFHDVVPLSGWHGVVAMERNVERHQKPRECHATKRGWIARSVENAGELNPGVDGGDWGFRFSDLQVAGKLQAVSYTTDRRPQPRARTALRSRK